VGSDQIQLFRIEGDLLILTTEDPKSKAEVRVRDRRATRYFPEEDSMTHDMQTRRLMVSGLGATVAAFALGSTTAAAQTPAARFQPARHAQDAWLDAVPGKHRTFIDASTPRGAGEAMLYANNLYEANKSGYSVPETDIVVVACLRHFATPFAFTNAIWAKYGKQLSMMIEFTDPKTKQPPSANLLFSADYGMALPNLGTTIDSVVKRGTRFAVCDMATHFFAGGLAMATKGNADAIYKELVASTIPNSHMVAAGVVAVNRSQEYGYTLLNTL
jgi:hypothetical protein